MLSPFKPGLLVHTGRALVMLAIAVASGVTGPSLWAQDRATLRHGDINPPVSVRDIIEWTTFGPYPHGDSPDSGLARSLDGQRFAVVVKRGDVVHNTLTYLLLAFRASELFAGPRPDTLLVRKTTATSTPAIAGVRWLGNGRTLLFLGLPNGGDRMTRPQIFELDVRARRLKQLTSSATGVEAFEVNGRGDLLYVAGPEPDPPLDPTKQARGFVVSPRSFVGDLVAGQWESTPTWTRPSHIFAMRRGSNGLREVTPDTVAHPLCRSSPLAIDPMGTHALVRCLPRPVPASWSGSATSSRRPNTTCFRR